MALNQKVKVSEAAKQKATPAFRAAKEKEAMLLVKKMEYIKTRV